MIIRDNFCQINRLFKAFPIPYILPVNCNSRQRNSGN